MNGITVNNKPAYSRPVGMQGQAPDVGDVANGGRSEVGKTGQSGGIVVQQGGSGLPKANGTGGKNVLVPSRTIVNGPDVQDVKNSLASFLEGFGTKDGRGDVEVNNAAILHMRRGEVKTKKAAEQEKFDTYSMMTLFDTSNSKRSNFATQMQMLNLAAASDNTAKRAEAAATQKKLGPIIAALVCQVGSGALGTVSNMDFFKTDTLKLDDKGNKIIDKATGKAAVKVSSTVKQISMDLSSRALALAADVFKYFEDGEGSEKRTVRENQAESIRSGIKELGSGIKHYSCQVVNLTDKVDKVLNEMLESEKRAFNGISS